MCVVRGCEGCAVIGGYRGEVGERVQERLKRRMVIRGVNIIDRGKGNLKDRSNILIDDK